MNQLRLPRASGVSVLIFLLTISGISYADDFAFRVAFDEVPGIDEIESGDLISAIDILEAQTNDQRVPMQGSVLATLCGVYIISASLRKAADACDEAIAVAPSKLAYNNRGVLRVQSGDLKGARADFDRARPKYIDGYLEFLRTKDIGLIADGNSELLDELHARRTQAKVNASFAVGSASIEDVMH